MTKAELKKQNTWYESGIAFIDGLRQRIKPFAFFKAQFGPVISGGAFESVTPEQLIEGLKVSPAFWDWWQTAFYEQHIGQLLIPTQVILEAINKTNNNGPKKREQPQRVARTAKAATGAVAMQSSAT